jgi:hypothetical protein
MHTPTLETASMNDSKPRTGAAVATILAITSLAMAVTAAEEAEPIGDAGISMGGQHLAWTSTIWDGEKFLIFGGHTGESPYVYRDEIWSYKPGDPGLNRFGTLPSPRAYTAAVFDGYRYAYVIGGTTGYNIGSREIVRVDTQSGAAITLQALLPHRDYGMGAVLLDGSVYILGGMMCPSHCPIRVFEPDSGRVATLAHGYTSRGVSAVASADGAAYVFGGKSGITKQFFDEVLRFRPEDGVQSLKARLAAPRSSGVALYDGGVIYVMGGINQRTEFDEVLTFDPKTEKLATYAYKLPAPSHTFSGAWGQTGYVFGVNTAAGLDRAFCFGCEQHAVAAVANPLDGEATTNGGADAASEGTARAADHAKEAERMRAAILWLLGGLAAVGLLIAVVSLVVVASRRSGGRFTCACGPLRHAPGCPGLRR